MKKNLLLSIVMVAFTLMSCSASNAEGSASAPAKGKTDNKMTKVKLETTLGDIVVELYNETPQHRDNFIKLVKEGYYNGVLFHRVIKDFMIQTGDGNSKNAGPETTLGDGDPGYTIEAEFVYPKYFHKRGALAAARTPDQMNPERRSSGSQFYIVTGKIFSSEVLKQMIQNKAKRVKEETVVRLVTENSAKIKQMQEKQDNAGMIALQNEILQQAQAKADSLTKLTDEQIRRYVYEKKPLDKAGAYGIQDGYDLVNRIEGSYDNVMGLPTEDIAKHITL